MCVPCSANKCRIRESDLQAACLYIIFLNGYNKTEACDSTDSTARRDNEVRLFFWIGITEAVLQTRLLPAQEQQKGRQAAAKKPSAFRGRLSDGLHQGWTGAEPLTSISTRRLGCRQAISASRLPVCAHSFTGCCLPAPCA